MTYDVKYNDRIGNKSDAGTFNYSSGANYKVDNISQLKTWLPKHDITYNDEGFTTQITETNSATINKKLTIDYGLDGQRFKTDFTQDGTLKFTRYYSGDYEKEIKEDGTVRHLNYIYAAGSLIAICEQTTAGDKLHYVFTDYMGSLRCITNETGAIEQRLSYDVWGNRRNYSNGNTLNKAEITDASKLTSRGFTGHEHVDALSLINMNARFYDPIMGLFVSPDKFVADPTSSQAFNRYTYANNNPLMYSDPSGHFAAILVEIGVIALEAAIQYAGHYADNVINKHDTPKEAFQETPVVFNATITLPEAARSQPESADSHSSDNLNNEGANVHQPKTDTEAFEDEYPYALAGDPKGINIPSNLATSREIENGVSIYIWKKDVNNCKDVGHTAIRIGNRVFGFYPTDENGDGALSNGELLNSKGDMHNNSISEFNKLYKNDQIDAFILRGSVNQMELLNNLMQVVRDPGRYKLTGNNCTSVAFNVLKRSGVDIPFYGVFPIGSKSLGLTPKLLGDFLPLSKDFWFKSSFTVK